MIHTQGAELLSRSQLNTIPVPIRDNAGKHWQGVPHGVLADTLVDHVQSLGFGIARETWYCNPNQSALYGSVDLAPGDTEYCLDIGQEALFSIGVRHDNGGRYAVSLAVGARIVVCSNGMFSGDFVLKHRHFSSLDLSKAVEDGVEEWLSRTDEIGRFARLMQGVELDDRDASYLVTQAALSGGEHECFPWEKAQKVVKTWAKPPHEEFAPRTMWSCYNSFTEVAKELSPPKQLRLLKGLRTMMTQFAEKGSLN